MPNGKLKIYIHFIQYIYSLSLLHSICVQRNAMRLKVDEPNGRAWNETLTFTWQHKAQRNDSTQNKRVHGGKIITFFDVAAAVRLPSNLSCQVDGVVSLKIDLKLCEPRKKTIKELEISRRSCRQAWRERMQFHQATKPLCVRRVSASIRKINFVLAVLLLVFFCVCDGLASPDVPF